MERTLLLVDDEESIGAALARLFRPDGYKILRAKSGQEALAMMTVHDVGVVITDQRMPEMTGVALLTQVKELYPHTMRIVLSGYTDLAVLTDAINHGAAYKFFTKPWNNDVMSAEVVEAFRHHELILEKEQLMRDIQAASQALAQVNLEWAEAVAQRDSQIEHMAFYSTLTNLPNRQFFVERLVQDILRAKREDQPLAVVAINLDQFKQINDSFSHSIGDVLLEVVAQRLNKHVRTGETIAHMGADGFSFVLPNIGDAQAVAYFAQRLLEDFVREPILIGDNEIFVSSCIGIALYPTDGEDANTLLKNADAALHHAKAEGHGSFQYYSKQMNVNAWSHLSLEAELRRALERNEFTLHYQPKVNLKDGKIIGMEALLRWQSPERGLVTPGEFIQILEKTGLILPVGTWVLDTACRQARAWQMAGLNVEHVAVNMSYLQLKQPNFVALVQNTLEKYHLDYGLEVLELELTESLLMKDLEASTNKLKALQEMGVRLSIDDFGTGYSCLSYLKHLLMNCLKIDQSFIRHLPDNREDKAIVQAILALGYGLGLSVIAEGVEDMKQAVLLHEMGCIEAQGYLFSRPIPANEMTLLLQSGKSLGSIEKT